MAEHGCWEIEGGSAKNGRSYCDGMVDNSNNCGKHQICVCFTECESMLQ